MDVFRILGNNDAFGKCLFRGWSLFLVGLPQMLLA